MSHASSALQSSFDHHRSPASALAIWRIQREGTRSTLRRRSPRGTHSTWRPAPARAARSWRCWRSTLWARRGSSSPAARRSWSGRRESSRVGEGNNPSARPRTTTRSRSRPTPMLTEPTSTPSPMRPTRPRSVSSSSSKVRVNTSRSTEDSTASRVDSRSRASSTRSAAFRSAGGQAARWRSSPASVCRSRRAQATRSPQACGLVAAAREVIDQSQRRNRGGPGPVWPRCAASRPATGERRGPLRPVRPASSWAAAKVVSRRSQSVRPATTPASREMRSQAVTRMGWPSWRSGPPASQANTSSRRNPLSGRDSSPSRVRPRTRAVSGMTAAPFRGIAGRRQLFVGQPGVGLGAGVQHGDAVERGSGPGRIDDHAHGGPHLLVAIGHGEDPGPRRGPRRRGVRSTAGRVAEVTAMRRTDRSTSASARASPVRPGQHDELAGVRHGAEQLAAVARESLGQVDDDRAETRRLARRPRRTVAVAASRRSSSS